MSIDVSREIESPFCGRGPETRYFRGSAGALHRRDNEEAGIRHVAEAPQQRSGN
jgi:hypothetical protein